MKFHISLIPRTLAIIYIALLTLLAFDVPIFNLGFLIHLIPTIIFLGCLIIAWFKPKLGGILFALAGIGTIIVFNTYRELITFLIVSAIPLIIGILFLFSKRKK